MNTTIEFKHDIEDGCENLIEAYNLQITEPYPGTFLLKGEKWNIEFSWDRGEVACFIIPFSGDKSKMRFNVLFVHDFLYRRKFDMPTQKEDNTWDSAKKQIESCVRMLQTGLSNVLNGDFSWANDYLHNKNRESQLSLFVLDLGIDNPIAKKLFSGDQTWQPDAEKYILENHVVLPKIK